MTGWFQLRGSAGLVPQVVIVVVAWGYLCGLHWDNDGLWFQGDSPRHAANGLFWKEYLLSLPASPHDYALSYYARYPVIHPTAYPPVFYLLEGAAFGLLGPSPQVAKGLVLLFALLAALYTTAWLRRWIAEEAGWAGPLLLLLPGVVMWSHAVMLNVPALALGVGGLYHARRWLESDRSFPAFRQLCAAAALSLLAVLTHPTAGVGVPIIIAWLVVLRRWDLLFRFRTVLVVLACVLLLLPWLLVAFRWAPGQVGRIASPLAEEPFELNRWLFYPTRLPELIDPSLLLLAAVGVIGGLLIRRWRKEVLLLLTWLAVAHVFFASVGLKDSRYALPIIPPLVCLCAIGIFSAAQGIGTLLRASQRVTRPAALAALAVLLVAQAWLAARLPLQSSSGFKEVAAFLVEVAPAERVFYDGYHDGVFTFHIQAGDPGYQRQVVHGSRLLYSSTTQDDRTAVEFTTSPEEVLECLRTRGGCRWLAIESGPHSEKGVSQRALREVVRLPQFQLVRSFPVTGAEAERVDVYRLLVPIETPDGVNLRFPALGRDVHYRIQPIQRPGTAEDARR